MIQISDIRNVAIDGSPVGAFVNAFQESKDPVACQIELERFFDALNATHGDALKAAQTAMQEQVDSAIAAKQEEHANALAAKQAELDAAIATHAAAIAAKEAAIEAIKATHEAIDAIIAKQDFTVEEILEEKRKTKKQRDIEAIRKEKEEAAAKVDELSAKLEEAQRRTRK